MSDIKNALTSTQTYYGCQHVKALLGAAKEQATSEYARIVQCLKQEGNISGQTYKNGDVVDITCGTTYLCLQCPDVSNKQERHRKDHPFSVERNTGFVFCHDCKDFVYDPTFEEIRSGNAKKRKLSALQEGDKRLIVNNSTPTPCAATGLRGLYNMGQTCFMSAILQSIIHNPLVRTFYLSEGHKAGDCEREACTSCALDDIFIDFLSQEKHEGYGAVHMLQACWKGGGGLAGYSQQDAHEYLGFILNSLHAANTANDDDKADGKAMHKVKDCDCVIHRTFGGLLKSTVFCSSCKNTTTSLDPFMDLSLDIRSSAVSVKKQKLKLTGGTATIRETPPMDLTECLDRFTTPETLSSDSYYCRKCSSSREATKKLGLTRLPPVIPIHLKRFSHSKTLAQSSKVETKIRFPFSLDLTPYTTSSTAKSKKLGEAKLNGDKQNSAEPNGDASKPDPEGSNDSVRPIYGLSSVIVHKGKIDNGHYISYSRQGDEWFRFDDSMVVQVDEKEVLMAEAYMLFYVVLEMAVRDE